MEIIRKPDASDLAEMTEGEGGMIPLSIPGRKIVKSPRDLFEEEIAKEEKKTIKKGLPFAIGALRAETSDVAKAWENRWRRRGYIDTKNDPRPTVGWNRYSDLKNFEVLDSGEKNDPFLTKVNKFPVFVKWTKYKFKDFPETYTVMESAESALDRALAKFKGESLEVIRKPETKATKK